MSKVNIEEPINRYCDVINEPEKELLPIDGYQNMPLVSLEQSIVPLYSIINDKLLDEKVRIAKKNCKNPPDNLTNDESASIHLYTMEATSTSNSLYYMLNQTLRSEDRKQLTPWFLFLKLFLTALFKLPSIKCKVWRGVKLDITKLYQPKRIWTWWGVTSCTDSLAVLQAETFLGNHGTRTIFHIDCLHGKDIRGHSYFPHENEIILVPASRFQVVSIDYQGDKLHYVEMKEIEPIQQMLQSPYSSMPTSEITEQAKLLANDLTSNQATQNFTLIMTTISNEDAEILSKAIAVNTSVNRLWIKGIEKISYKGMKMLIDSLKCNRNIKELLIIGSENYRVNHNPQALADVLEVNTVLERLFVDRSMISDVCVALICESLKLNNTLKLLSLRHNHITSTGCKHIADALLSNRSIEDLKLGSNAIHDDGVMELANLFVKNCTLKRLDLSNNGLTAHSCKVLNDIILTNTCRLVYLDLSENSLDVTSHHVCSLRATASDRQISLLI